MGFGIRPLASGDIAAIQRIYKAHLPPRARRLAALRSRIEASLAGRHTVEAVALGCVVDVGTGRERLCGYLVGEVRSWEFGSEPAGWIFAVGVDPRQEGSGVGKMLLDAAEARFSALGVRTVRTMVQKDDVKVLRFFRSGHFSAGPYVELELELGHGVDAMTGGGMAADADASGVEA